MSFNRTRSANVQIDGELNRVRPFNVSAEFEHIDVLDVYGDDDECMICIQLVILPTCAKCCKRVFCADCIINWLENGPESTCPNCRALLRRRDLSIMEDELSRLMDTYGDEYIQKVSTALHKHFDGAETLDCRTAEHIRTAMASALRISPLGTSPLSTSPIDVAMANIASVNNKPNKTQRLRSFFSFRS